MDLDPFDDDLWLREARRWQRAISSRHAERLARRLVGASGDQLRGYVLWEGLGEPGFGALDAETLLVLLRVELERHCLEAVIGLTDWAAARVVRSALGSTGTCVGLIRDDVAARLPLTASWLEPDDHALARLESDYGVPPRLAADVWARLAEEPELPLIGRVVDGELHVAVEALSRWAEGYDWS